MPISISRVFKQKNGDMLFEFGEYVCTQNEKMNTKKSKNFPYQEVVNANIHQQGL
jgi:hypothetical protein